MPVTFFQLLMPLISLSVCVIAQVLGFRFIPKLELLKSIAAGFVLGLASLFIFEFYLPYIGIMRQNEIILNLLTNFIVYSSLGYCYFHFINLGETARRVRILWELNDSKGGLTMDEILERYNTKKIVEKRLARLLNNKQIIDKNGKYYIGKPTMLLISKIILLMKILILGKRSEFDRF